MNILSYSIAFALIPRQCSLVATRHVDEQRSGRREIESWLGRWARTMGSGGYIYVHDILRGSVAKDGGVMALRTHCNIINTPSVPSFEIRGQRGLRLDL